MMNERVAPEEPAGQAERGLLYVVATPIGNLGDITARAREILAGVAAIAAEDTRKTGQLLARLGIATRLIAYHDHNETAAAPGLLRLLEEGQSLALVSDAGTPLISDPGYTLVAAARARGLRVVPIPGANAAICALSAAGLPSDRFLFLGFPPRTTGQRQAWLTAVAQEPGTLVLYESGQRALATLADIETVLGPHRRIVIARELTKSFETFLDGNAARLRERLLADPQQQLGELVILVEGDRQPAASREDEGLRVLEILAAELPLSQAANLAARLSGAKKNALYRHGLARGWGASADAIPPADRDPPV